MVLGKGNSKYTSWCLGAVSIYEHHPTESVVNFLSQGYSRIRYIEKDCIKIMIIFRDTI